MKTFLIIGLIVLFSCTEKENISPYRYQYFYNLTEDTIMVQCNNSSWQMCPGDSLCHDDYGTFPNYWGKPYYVFKGSQKVCCNPYQYESFEDAPCFYRSGIVKGINQIK